MGNRTEELRRVPMDKVLVLDTETTGFDHRAEVLQFSAMWGSGEVAMNRYIRPSHTKYWFSAMAVNHITPEMVAGEPVMDVVAPDIEAILTQAKVIVGYNLPFDLNMLAQNGVHLPDAFTTRYIDLMEPFAEVYGEWNPKTESYKWQKLITCARYYGYQGGGWHDSLADVRATLYCYKAMLAKGDL